MRIGKCPGCRRKGVNLRTTTISETSKRGPVRTLDICAACFGRFERGELLFDPKMGRRQRASSSRV